MEWGKRQLWPAPPSSVDQLPGPVALLSLRSCSGHQTVLPSCLSPQGVPWQEAQQNSRIRTLSLGVRGPC